MNWSRFRSIIRLAKTPSAFISCGIKQVFFPGETRGIARVGTNLFIDVRLPIFVPIELELIVRLLDVVIDFFQRCLPAVMLEGELDFAK